MPTKQICCGACGAPVQYFEGAKTAKCGKCGQINVIAESEQYREDAQSACPDQAWSLAPEPQPTQLEPEPTTIPTEPDIPPSVQPEPSVPQPMLQQPVTEMGEATARPKRVVQIPESELIPMEIPVTPNQESHRTPNPQPTPVEQDLSEIVKKMRDDPGNQYMPIQLSQLLERGEARFHKAVQTYREIYHNADENSPEYIGAVPPDGWEDALSETQESGDGEEPKTGQAESEVEATAKHIKIFCLALSVFSLLVLLCNSCS